MQLDEAARQGQPQARTFGAPGPLRDGGLLELEKDALAFLLGDTGAREIGRASCRERV